MDYSLEYAEHHQTPPDLTLPALSIRQPWAWLILHGGKNVENRTWRTRFRGRFLIHAAKGMTVDEYNQAFSVIQNHVGSNVYPPIQKLLSRGGIVGEAEIVDCVQQMDSPWFFGPFGFVLRNAKPVAFTPCRGALGFFKWKRPSQPGPSLNSSRTAIDVGPVVPGTS